MNAVSLENFSGDRLRALANLQEVLVRAYFSDSLLDQLAKDREGTLIRLGIVPGHYDLVPHPGAADFQAECWGRRSMVAREIHRRYPRFLRHVIGERAGPAKLAHHICFRSFLDSEQFFSPEFAMEHPYGMGRGYENVSKFFFWLKEQEMDPRALNDLYLDFSFFVAVMAAHSELEFFRKAKAGIVFRDNLDPEYAFVMANGKIIRIRSGIHWPEALTRLACLHETAYKA